MSNQKELRELKKVYGITSQQVADLLKVSVITVTSWLRAEGGANHRGMSDSRMDHLKARLKGKKKKI